MNIFRRRPKVDGLIRYLELAEWWLATFDEGEQQYIEDLVGRSPTGPGYITKGTVTSSSARPVQFLTALAGNFYRQSDWHIAVKMLSMAEKLVKTDGNVLDLHFLYAQRIKTFYRWRDSVADALDEAIRACESQIALGTQAAKSWRSEYPGEDLPAHTGFEQLRIIREKQGLYEEAIELCRQAMSQGWAGYWQDDIARLEKRKARTAHKICSGNDINV